VIDAHHHLWQLGANGCGWPTPDLPAIYRDFGLQDFVPIAQAAGVTGSVLVQSQPCDADTDYLLQLADGSGFIKAVVGWVDLASANAPARIAQLTQPRSLMQDGGAIRPSKLRSLRPMLQLLVEDDWVLRPELAPAIAVMKTHQLAFDALVYPRHLPHLHQFALHHPDLPIVIDHAAKPAIAADSQPARAWLEAMEAMADLPNVYCKLSGLATEAGTGQDLDVLVRYITRLVALFGSERLMWGSDWPVLGLAANPYWSTYTGWLDIVRAALSGSTPSDIEQIFTGTSERFYQIT
jgi:L-fuconolactonase